MVIRDMYDWSRFLLQFGFGDAVKPCEEEEDSVDKLIMTIFVEQPLALSGSVNTYRQPY